VTLVGPGLSSPAGPTASAPADAATQIVHGFDQLRGMAAQIDELALRCGAPVTARPPWVLATLSMEPDRDPWGVLVRDGGALVACALLADSTGGPGPGLIRIAGSGSGHRGALLADSAPAASRLARALAEALVTRTTSFRLSLGPVDASCATVAVLTRVLPGAVAAAVDPIPVVQRNGSSAAVDYLAPSMRRTIRKASNRLARDGHTFSVTFTVDRGRIARALPVLAECHRDRDHARGRDSDLDDQAARLLWHARLRALADEGCLELATAHIDGHLAAYVLGILDRPAYRVLEGHLVTRWSRYAPGRVLEAAVLQRMLDDEAYDALDWMTSLAPESLLAANDRDAVVVVSTG
jgi:Acetyltransferase (GNAT) domain